MRVLLAEDEVTIFVTLRDALEDAGHEVIGATDTASALKALELEPAADAVVTDVRMPGEGGLAILDRAMALDPERPVLLMTGYATVDDAVDAMRRGAVDYIQKPFRNEAVLRRLDTLSRVSDLEEETRELRDQRPAIVGDVEGNRPESVEDRRRRSLPVVEPPAVHLETRRAA